jgi:outer membrane protein
MVFAMVSLVHLSARLACVVFVAITVVSAAGVRAAEVRASDGRAVSLDEAVSLAIGNNPQILKAREEILRATGQVVEFSAARLPTISVNGQAGVEDRSRFEAQPGFARSEQGSWNLGARIRQTVYAGGRISGNVRIATLQRQEAVAALDAVVQDIVLGVETNFYEALRQRALVGVAEEQIRLLGEELGDQQKRAQAGSVPEFNVLRARVELANAQPDLIRAKNAHRIAIAELARLIAIEAKAGPGLPFEVTGDLAASGGAYTLTAALNTALIQRSELDALEIRVAAARQQISVEAAGLKPEVSVFGGYDFLSEQFRGPSHATNGAIIGLQAEWKVFDFGATRGRMDQARAKARQVELDLEDTRRQIELEVRKAWSRYLEAKELIESQQQNVEVAVESLRQARVRFDAGGSTQLDVLASQTALTEARTNELEARADLKQSLSELRRAMGVLAPVTAGGYAGK